MTTAIVWFRSDLRLSDNPALEAACRAADSILAVYIHSPASEGAWAPGAASNAWLARSLASLDADLRRRGSQLTIRCGEPQTVLAALLAETGAEQVHCNRRAEPAWLALDARVDTTLAGSGARLHRHAGNFLLPPRELLTGQGTPYRMFTPYWRRLQTQLETLARPCPAPARLAGPMVASESIDALGLRPSPAWDAGFWKVWEPGESGAQQVLHGFLAGSVRNYFDQRDRPDHEGTSRLSPHLHFGEISPRQVLYQTLDADASDAHEGGWAFLRELGWREFSSYLLFHFPASCETDLSPRFADFPWNVPRAELLQAWQRGHTGVPIIDAGMRQLWQTGWMHNRVRMLVASFLTKHLRVHWMHGARWFWDTLVDADLANNTQGWQWCAGTGVDSAPYFRIFNPVLQGERFDPNGDYVKQWVPELHRLPAAVIHAPWRHPALAQRLAPTYPRHPVVDLAQARVEALAAWHSTSASSRAESLQSR